MDPITPRERLPLALDHQQTDRVLLDFGTGGNTSPVPEVYAGLAQVDESILQVLDIYRSQRDGRPVEFPLAAEPGSGDFDGRLVQNSMPS